MKTDRKLYDQWQRGELSNREYAHKRWLNDHKRLSTRYRRAIASAKRYRLVSLDDWTLDYDID